MPRLLSSSIRSFSSLRTIEHSKPIFIVASENKKPQPLRCDSNPRWKLWLKFQRNSDLKPLTPLAGLLSPVFFFFRGQIEFDRIGSHHFQICPSVRTVHNLSLFYVLQLNVGFAFRTVSHAQSLLGVSAISTVRQNILE